MATRIDFQGHLNTDLHIEDLGWAKFAGGSKGATMVAALRTSALKAWPGELNYEHTSNCKSLPAPDDCLDLFGLYQKWATAKKSIYNYIYYIYTLPVTLSERERECAGPMRSPSSILLTTLGVDLFQLGRLWGEKSRMGVCVCATSKLNKCNMKSCKTNHPFP